MLAIPVSTIVSESTFSVGGCVSDSFHSSLSPNIAEALICAQDWLKDVKKNEPMKLRECMDNVEYMEGFEIDTHKRIYMLFILFI